METIRHFSHLKLKKQVRSALMLASTATIVISSLLAYNRITYEFPLAVGNTGQSALGPPTSAGVGILLAMIVVAAILGLGAALSIFGSSMRLPNRSSDVALDSASRVSTPRSQDGSEWEDVSTKNQTKTTDDEILNALWHSKDKKSDAAE